jgi:pimeloyl-ACP methyl ester carboxylesterase
MQPASQKSHGQQANNSHIQLADGRVLSYAEYGAPDGAPVFYFHGWPGSRHEGVFISQPGIRVIAAERPGMGRSDFKPNRTLLDWANDVSELADKLGITRFGVLGFSGGGPYAIACAYRIPERLSATVIVNGLGPLTVPNALTGLSAQHRMVFRLARWAPWLLTVVLQQNLARLRARAERGVYNPPPTAMPDCDRQLIKQHPHLRQTLMRDLLDAFEQGTRGPVLEQQIYAADWGFSLSNVHVPVHLWQGLKDINVSPSMGRHMANTLPNCHAHLCEDEGHISLIHNLREKITQPFVAQRTQKENNTTL